MAGQGGAGFGIATSIYRQSDLGVDVTAGFDDLFFAGTSELFGHHPVEPPSRVWVGTARTWSWVVLRSSVAAEAEGDAVEFVPYGSVDVHMPFHSSLGWETSYAHDVWRNHLGAHLGWDPFSISFGLTEVQSWVVRNGEFGWWNLSRPGHAEGIDNPGWWFGVGFELPTFTPPPPPPAPPATVRTVGPVHLDEEAYLHLEEVLVERQVRADLAELALRLQAAGVDPLESGSLRRRILSGGTFARRALWKVALDSVADPAERVQAVATAGNGPQVEDLDALEALTSDPAPRLRAECAFVLGRIPGARSERLLRRLSLDPEEQVRRAVSVVTLGR